MENELFDTVIKEMESTGTANDRYFLAGIEEVELKTIQAIAKAYAAKQSQKQHLVELMKMDEKQDCFDEPEIQQKLYDYEDGKIDYPAITSYLNLKASQYATDRAKKALETFSKEYEIAVGGSLMMRIRVSEQFIEVVGAIDGYGHSVTDQISIIEITDPKNLEV